MSDNEYMDEGIGEEHYLENKDTKPSGKKKFNLPKIDFSKGILGDRTIGFGKIKFKLNEIALPFIQPKFDQRVKETGDSFALYMNVIDLLHGFAILFIHFFCYCFYIFCSLGFPDQLRLSSYDYFSWIAALLFPILYLVVAIPKYFILYSGCRMKNEKKKMIFFIVYFVLSGVVCIFFLFLSIGGPGAVGLIQTIIVAYYMNRPSPNFVKIWLFLTCLGITLVFLTQIVINVIVVVMVIIRIVKVKKGGVTTKGNASVPGDNPGIAGENEGEWGGVDFNENEGGSGDEYL